MSLWTTFNSTAAAVTNDRFVPDTFVFAQGKDFLSEWPQVLTAIGTYYVIIFGGQALVRALGIPPLQLKPLVLVHNLVLTVCSLILFLLLAEQLVPMLSQHGLYYAVCDTGSWNQRMITLYYVNYLLKYFEFIDTMFLVLKHKKLTFLHTYHHGATALLCYTQLLGGTSISWVPILLNLAVHVIMYWYYFLSTCGIHAWWKAWVTRTQILQFVVDVAFIYFTTYQKVVFMYWPNSHLPFSEDCSGTLVAHLWGGSILTSYLVLFILFYEGNYPKKKGGKKVSRGKKRV